MFFQVWKEKLLLFKVPFNMTIETSQEKFNNKHVHRPLHHFSGCSEGRASSWPICQSSWPAAAAHKGERIDSGRGYALWQGGLVPQGNFQRLVLISGIFVPLRQQMHRNLFFKWCILGHFCVEDDGGLGGLPQENFQKSVLILGIFMPLRYHMYRKNL